MGTRAGNSPRACLVPACRGQGFPRHSPRADAQCRICTPARMRPLASRREPPLHAARALGGRYLPRLYLSHRIPGSPVADTAWWGVDRRSRKAPLPRAADEMKCIASAGAADVEEFSRPFAQLLLAEPHRPPPAAVRQPGRVKQPVIGADRDQPEVVSHARARDAEREPGHDTMLLAAEYAEVALPGAVGPADRVVQLGVAADADDVQAAAPDDRTVDRDEARRARRRAAPRLRNSCQPPSPSRAV